ncbi:MAG: DUF3108 domain-containing protein [Gemmatimonadetes bacterium]|nr:DUF3108 domain-containing protein [Gemmatimonadota bacterium]
MRESRAARLALLGGALLTAVAVGGAAAAPRTQEGAVAVVTPTLARAMQEVPFAIGESLSYSVKFGFARIGSGSMYVQGPAQVRGVDVIHTMFRITGGTFFFKINDLMQSWIEPKTFASMRFWQDISEGNYTAHRRYEFFPEKATYVENDKPEKPSVSAPLDDGSFLYFIRTQPLEVGREYSYDRYFDPESNPVRIRVLRKERVRVPAGEFDAVVLQPIIKTSGIFSEGGRAEIWLTDDNRHLMLQMKSKLSFGSLNLYLLRYRLAEGGTWMGEDP